jgi:hypothetical protein
LPTPSGAEQEGDTGNDCQRGVGPRLDRFIDRLDDMIGGFAHRTGRIEPLVVRVGERLVDAGLGAAPGRVAAIGQDCGDLVRQPVKIFAQLLQIVLDIAGGFRRCIAHLAHSLARVFGRLANVL